MLALGPEGVRKEGGKEGGEVVCARVERIGRVRCPGGR